MSAKPIRYALIDSLHPEDDKVLLAGEWAATREASSQERARLSIARNRPATAFVLRTCQTPQTLIAWQEKRDTSIAADVRGAPARLARKNGFTFKHAASAIALGGAGIIAPEIVAKLATQAPPAGLCERCTCIWSPSGPFNPNSDEGQAFRALALGEDESLRRAAA